MDEVQKKKLLELVLQHSGLFIVEKGELVLIKQKTAHIQVSDLNSCRAPFYRYKEKAKETVASILKDREQNGCP